MNGVASNKIYIVDSSSLITLNRFNDDAFDIPQAVWDKLDELLDEGILCSIRCVFNEIVTDSEKPDVVSAWLKPKKLLFHNPTNTQVIYMAEAVKLFSGLVNPESEKEQADPWLIAYAREMNKLDSEHKYVIVTQENPRSPIKIPAAAKHYGIETINLKDFFKEVGITLGA